MPRTQELLLRALLDIYRFRGDEVLEEIHKWLGTLPFVKSLEIGWEKKDDSLSRHVLVDLKLDVPLWLDEDEQNRWNETEYNWVKVILARPWTKQLRVTVTSFCLYAEIVTLTAVATCTACGALKH